MGYKRDDVWNKDETGELCLIVAWAEKERMQERETKK